MPVAEVSRTTIKLSKEEIKEIRKALKEYGSITRMQESTGLSRNAIVGTRDLGRCEAETLRKIKEYLASQKAAS